jgi:hypothetical protein
LIFRPNFVAILLVARTFHLEVDTKGSFAGVISLSLDSKGEVRGYYSDKVFIILFVFSGQYIVNGINLNKQNN